MAAFVKFYCYPLDLGLGTHDFSSDVLEVYLTNTAPDVAADTVKADLPEIAHGNGYNAPVPINNVWAQSGGIATVTGDASSTITAAGGSIGPYRYVVLYNSTATDGPLIGFWDYGAPLTLSDGATFTVDYDPAILQVQ